MTPIKQTLTFERATKNTYVYKADKGSAVDTLYVQKDAIRAMIAPSHIEPARLTIIVEPA